MDSAHMVIYLNITRTPSRTEVCGTHFYFLCASHRVAQESRVRQDLKRCEESHAQLGEGAGE